MNIEKIINERHSVRSYLDKEIEKDKITKLNNEINSINKNNNLNIQLVLNDREVFDKFILSYGRIKNCNNYIALIGKKNKDLDEVVGYYGEKLVLLAQELGLNTCWVAGTYRKGLVKAKINEDEKLVCIIALGYGKTSGVKRKSKKFDDVVECSNYPDWFKKGVEYSLLAPTAMNQQKFKFNYIDKNIVEAKAIRGHLTKLDLGIVKYHFELGAKKEIEWRK